MRPQRAAIAAEIELHLQLPRPRFEIGQVEFEDVMTLDHIRITLAHQRDEFFQHRLLLRFVLGILDNQDLLPP